MKCGFCGEKMTKGIRDYPQREQLRLHQERKHLEALRYHQKLEREAFDRQHPNLVFKLTRTV